MAVFRVPITLTWSGVGSPGVNVWHVRCVDGPGSTVQDELQSAVGAIHTFYDSIKSYLAQTTVVTLGDIVKMDDSTSWTAGFTQINSTASAGQAAPMLCTVIGWRTSVAARRGMGRTFIGPLASAYVDTTGTPSASMITGIGTAAQTLITASLGSVNGWAIGVWGLVNPAPPGTPPAGYLGLPREHRDIIAYKIKDKFGVLRSRRQ